MSILLLAGKELLHRRFNFILSLAAVTAAAALFVFLHTSSEASERETTRIMRDLGFNLRIVSKKEDLEGFWARGFAEETLPEADLARFAEQEDIAFAHLLGVLRRKVSWRGREIVLAGLSSEVSPRDAKKKPMIFTIAPGTVHVGYRLARGLDLRKGDSVDLLGRPFRVAGVLSESGTEDDITVFADLHDVQGLLGMEGRISEIKALECLCRDPARTTREVLEDQLARILPDARVIRVERMAAARERQRIMVERYFAAALPMVLLVCAAWLALLSMLNVRDRRREIGILRALGYGSGYVAGLFLGRAFLIGLAGAVLGYALGTESALEIGAEVFEITAKSIRPAWGLLPAVLAGAPLFTMVAALVPAAAAVAADPAAVLREDAA